jgi:hypothetical protein
VRRLRHASQVSVKRGFQQSNRRRHTIRAIHGPTQPLDQLAFDLVGSRFNASLDRLDIRRKLRVCVPPRFIIGHGFVGEERHYGNNVFRRRGHAQWHTGLNHVTEPVGRVLTHAFRPARIDRFKQYVELEVQKM